MFDQKKVIEFLSQGVKSYVEITRNLHVSRKQNPEFSRWLVNLVKQGIIFQTPERNYFIPEFKQTFKGNIRVNARGFGFVDIKNDESDVTSVFVAPSNINSSMDGDEVIVKVFEDPAKPGFYQGIIDQILKRNRQIFVARTKKFGSQLGLIPLDERIRGRFRFINGENLKPDYEVKVEIIDYQEPKKVKLLKILGHKNDVAIDILTAIEDANIPYHFNPQTLQESKNVPSEVSNNDLVKRQDLRERLIVTIDGDDTKDFDDAIEVKKLANGNYYLGIHIADVTHYVKEDTALDEEAKLRGTSVYLADRVIPMLPEKLSNGICSLNPHQDRLTMSCEVEINPQGENVKTKIFPSVINSKYRLTYRQVNDFYRNNFSWDDVKLHQMLKDALSLSKIMRDYKEKQGYIDFEIEEAKIIIDEKGKTKDIVPRERLESEMMIEDFMVRANESVAKYVEEQKLPFIYRVHDKPDLDKVANLQGVVKALNIDVTIPQSPVPIAFAKAINQIKKTRFDDFMKIMLLRTMSKAEYAMQNIGHFGLASRQYSHFTSPIRRYPDLLAHRMLRTYFFKDNKKAANHFESIIPSISEHSSATEQKAMELERKVADIKKAEFYERFIGQSFEGTIVSMLKFGFFVEFPNKVDGLVHVSSLIDGDYQLSDNGYALKSKKRIFKIGDKIKATVVGIAKKEGKIDLVVSDLYHDWKQQQAKIKIL